jgi:Ca2+:H+ antiporter
MNPLLREIRRNPMLWLLVFVPVVFAAAKFKPEAQTVLFILSVLAIVPLAALLSHATESVAAKTGDAAGGLLNATLGNLTELVIALAALGAGEYTLVKASIVGAIVTNTLFMLGASFLLGGLKYHVQDSTGPVRVCRQVCSSWPQSPCWCLRRCWQAVWSAYCSR